MKITMIGSGYVGLVSGACLSDFGHEIVCVDKDASKIAALEAGRMPIFEPGLDQLVVTKSTIPVGTGDKVEAILRETRTNFDWAVVSNPEFLREGAAIGDFKRPDRIVVGTEDARAQDVMREVYRPLYLNAAPLLFTGRRTAELITYAANAFLATKIGFINELADLAEQVGADIKDVSRGIGLDNRIGSKFLHAGPGYGGSCFPKDTLALLKTAEDYGVPLRIVHSTVEANDLRKVAMGHKVVEALGGSAKGKRVGLLGLAFKPNTDDMRDAPAIDIVKVLRDAGAEIAAHDPESMDQARAMLGELDYKDSPYDVAKDADALVLVTEWDAFRALDLKRLAAAMRRPVLVDLRNVYNPAEAEKAGLSYYGIGRGVAGVEAPIEQKVA
jgi:UDPglucose 6-dehydrogenase